MASDTTDRWMLLACLPLLLGGPVIWSMAENWMDYFYAALAVWTGGMNALIVWERMKRA